MLSTLLKSALIGLLLSLSVQAQDVDLSPPGELIERSTSKMLVLLDVHKDALKENPSLIYPMVEDNLMENFDFNKMSKLALGKNWRRASVSQRDDFTGAFRLLLLRTYSTALLEFTNETVNFLPVVGDLSKKKVKVKTLILQSGGPSIPLDFSMYQGKASDWRVYDIKISGISMVTTYRTTFANIIRKEGIEGLILSLIKRNDRHLSNRTDIVIGKEA